MLYGAEVAACSEKSTKHINTLWAECRIVGCKTGGASRDKQALKGQCHCAEVNNKLTKNVSAWPQVSCDMTTRYREAANILRMAGKITDI